MEKFDRLLKFLSENFEEKKVKEILDDPEAFSLTICISAHFEQVREDGKRYYVHPIALKEKYEDILLLKSDEHPKIDMTLLDKLNIPFFGVKEVCLLHDVIEDTDYTIEDLEELFSKVGFKNYFNECIKEPLIYITHNKDMSYDDYIDIVMKHPISALVKMLDLNNNSDIFSLISFDDNKFNRTINYMKYIKKINDKYHFLENIAKYRKEKLRW